jgi:hypothetical protein
MSLFQLFYLYVVKSLHVSAPLVHPQEIHTAVDTTIGSVSVPFWSRALYQNGTDTELCQQLCESPEDGPVGPKHVEI